MVNPAFSDENHLARIRKLQIINPKIIIENHIRDYNICENYFNETDIKAYETMLYATLLRIENKLYRERLWRNLFDDYLDIYDRVAEIVIRKSCDFNGSSLFSTWAYGIMHNVLLEFYRKRKKLQTLALTENIAAADTENTIISNLTVKEYLSILTKIERTIVIAVVFRKLTFNDLSKISSKSVGFIKKHYKIALEKVKSKIVKNTP